MFDEQAFLGMVRTNSSLFVLHVLTVRIGHRNPDDATATLQASEPVEAFKFQVYGRPAQ